jgi:CheY-like chemotaxis protein
MIQTDPLRLKQILVNLLGNALKFTSQGSIGLRVTYEPGSPRIRFVVSDTGIGMSQEQVGRLFQAFSQADSSTTRRFGGSGLGLTISMKLAKLLGGQITVESAPRRGSAFTVEISVGSLDGVEMLTGVRESLLGTPAHQTPIATTRLNARILLAEDGPDNQRLISTHLRRAGANVVVAPDGQVAVDLMRKEHFDLVLMDMQMPVLDGYGATCELRQKGFKQPIVALTAHAMAEDRAKCLAAGCSDYLTKPVERDKLLNTIALHLGSQPSKEAGPQPDAPAPAPAEATLQKSEFAGDPDMQPLIEEYVRGLPEQVNQLVSLVREGDMKLLQRAVHQLKGSGGGYGFARITQLAAASEQSIKAGNGLERIGEQVDELIKCIQSVQGYPTPGEETRAADSAHH